MDKDERRGARKDRNQRTQKRIPDLGYYLIITDAEKTEKNYFEGLRSTIPADKQDRLVIKVEQTKLRDLVSRAIELRDKEPQYRTAWIVFDKDELTTFDEIISAATDSNIKVAWSNPCIEMWFFAYFGHIPNITDQITCNDKFEEKFIKVTGQKYDKADTAIYNKLVKYGNEIDAISLSEKRFKQLLHEGKTKPSEMYSANKVYELVNEIRSKC